MGEGEMGEGEKWRMGEGEKRRMGEGEMGEGEKGQWVKTLRIINNSKC